MCQECFIFSHTDGTLTSHMEYFTIDTHSGVITNGEIIDTDSADIRAAGSVFTLSVMVTSTYILKFSTTNKVYGLWKGF